MISQPAAGVSADVERQLEDARKRIRELESNERAHRRVSGVLARLAALADHNPSALVEIDYAGVVTYRNDAARDMFPTLQPLGARHPLLDGALEIAERMKADGAESVTREARVGDRVFNQKVVISPDAPRISVYSDDVTQAAAAYRALEAATSEAELLAGENALLAEVGRIFSSSLDIDDVYERFAAETRRLIPFDRIAISMYDAASRSFTNDYVLGVPAPGRERGSAFPMDGSMVGHCIEKRDATIFQGDVDALRRRFPNTVRSGLKSVIAAPIIFKDDVLGVLNLRSLAPEAYNAHHLDLMRKVTAQIAPAVVNARLYAQHTAAEAEAERLAAQNAALAAIGRVISASLEIEEVYAGFAAQARSLVPFDRISVNLIHEGSDEFHTAYSIGARVKGRRAGDSTPLAGTFTEQIYRQRRAAFFHSESREETLGKYPGLGAEYETGLRSFLSAPLIYKDVVIGTLNFRSLSRAAYSPRDVEVAEQIGAQVAGALANSLLHAETIDADRALKRQAEELTRSNVELEQFAYIASHDLQEPLRVIAGYVHLIEERYVESLDQDAREFIGFVVDATQRMRVLIRGLLDYSRVESHGQRFQLTDCNDSLADAMSDLSVYIDETKAAVTSDRLPTVMGDSVQISHILENLIANAIKFRKDDVPPVIHISSFLDEEEDAWRFSVTDNGVGIRPRYQDRIFGMFKRAHRRSKYPGAGIGLALCAKIVDRHGGHIWVESEVDKGSTFHFTIPTAEEAIE